MCDIQVNPAFLVVFLAKFVRNAEISDLLQTSLKVADSLRDPKVVKCVDLAVAQMRLFLENNLKESKIHELIPMQSQPQKVSRLYVDGCFDLMHSGHFNAIRQAKQYCDALVVGVISTEEITKRKGPPVLSYEERVGIARACKWADEIYENAPYDPTIELIDRLHCSHVAHGDDLIIGTDGKDAYMPFKESNRMITFKRTEGISTTDIVGRLLLMTKPTPNLAIQEMINKKCQVDTIVASKIDQIAKPISDNCFGGEEERSTEQSAVKVKLWNTTKRIRQFSQGNREPKETDRIVYIDGSYDLLHIGHVETLKKARELGDYLIVGLHDDETVGEQRGINYPVLTLQERVLSVLSMKYVDEVILGSPWVVSESLIRQFNISVVVEGSMTKLNLNPHLELAAKKSDPYAIPKQLGIYQMVQSSSELTTDSIISRIIDSRMRYLEDYKVKNKKEDLYYKSERRVKEI